METTASRPTEPKVQHGHGHPDGGGDSHPHDHSSPDGHHHPPESYAHVQGGPTVLDIGGDIGALLANLPPEAAGTELHLTDERDPDRDVHTGVWRRHAPSGLITTAVFSELEQGWYGVLDPGGTVVQRVEIRGGEVSTVDLR